MVLFHSYVKLPEGKDFSYDIGWRRAQKSDVWSPFLLRQGRDWRGSARSGHGSCLCALRPGMCGLVRKWHRGNYRLVGLIQQQCHGDCWLVDVGFLFAHLLQGAMVLECLFTYHMIISCWGRCWYPKMHRIAFSVHSFGGFWPIDHSVLTWNWLVASRWKAIGWITMGYCRFATSKTCWLVVSTITVIQLGFTKHGNM